MADVAAVKARTDLAALIGERVTLRRTGSAYRGECPFHGGRGDVFVVLPEREFWYCHGCGRRGDALDWLREVDGAEFAEALATLADRAGIHLDDLPPPKPHPWPALREVAAVARRTGRIVFDREGEHEGEAVLRDLPVTQAQAAALARVCGEAWVWTESERAVEHLLGLLRGVSVVVGPERRPALWWLADRRLGAA